MQDLPGQTTRPEQRSFRYRTSVAAAFKMIDVSIRKSINQYELNQQITMVKDWNIQCDPVPVTDIYRFRYSLNFLIKLYERTRRAVCTFFNSVIMLLIPLPYFVPLVSRCEALRPYWIRQAEPKHALFPLSKILFDGLVRSNHSNLKSK